MLEVKNLIMKYNNKVVLDNVNFHLDEGDVMAVAGENGSGKTTLITLLSTNKKRTSGEIDYSNEKNNYKVIKEKIGYIPQEIALFDELTVIDNFRIFGKISNHEDFNFIKVIEVLELKDILNSKISKLSGGTKRRVNIGVELVRDPSFIFMDEPIVGIDYQIRKKIVTLINNLKDQGKIIVISSHNLYFLKSTCNKLLKLNDGKQEYFGEYNHEIL